MAVGSRWSGIGGRPRKIDRHQRTGGEGGAAGGPRFGQPDQQAALDQTLEAGLQGQVELSEPRGREQALLRLEE